MRSGNRKKSADSSTPFEPTAEQRTLVENLTAFGLTGPQIAAQIINQRTGKPISSRTLYRKLRAELTAGLPKANAMVANALFVNATKKGDVIAQIFWLKTRAGWREVQYVQIVPRPSEMTDEQLDTFIDNAQADLRAREAGGNVASLSAYRKRPPPPG